VSNSILHYQIIKFIIKNRYAPNVAELSEIMESPEKEISIGLKKLQEGHGIVLHPNSYKIWVIHPFSLAPTNFLVKNNQKEWWGNCAWCSLGIAALLNDDVTITTTIGANDKQISIHIKDGKVLENNLFIHFPIPMKNAWDNVIYTCSTMLLFENEDQINEWSSKHKIPKGDVQPIEKICEFSKVWYGNHLNPKWKKWSSEEAKEIFRKFNLTHEIWDIPVSNTRF
jgi:hypothetical protein